jgi:hypothetical protein
MKNLIFFLKIINAYHIIKEKIWWVYKFKVNKFYLDNFLILNLKKT